MSRPPHMHEAEVLYSDPHLAVSCLERAQTGTGRALISFTGVGHAQGGVDVQRPEFVTAGNQYDAIFFVSDLTRSWGNLLDFGKVAEIVASRVGTVELHCIGNSMGAFNALLAPSQIPVSRVVAFAPQFSVHPEIVPWEIRWEEYRRAISDWKYPSLEAVWSPQSEYFVFVGNKGRDHKHARMFPKLPNLHLTRVEGRHNLARGLKEAGILQEVIRRCFAGEFTPEWFQTVQPQNTAAQ